MKFILQYLKHTDIFSVGFLNNSEGTYGAFIIADPPREKKISGITRYKAGLYELGIKEVLTPLTIKHREVYGDWFEYHIEILGVPEFKDLYVHSGNDAGHTDGCTLPNYTVDLTKKSNQGSLSTLATKDFYKLVYPLLKKGERCYIEVKDEQI